MWTEPVTASIALAEIRKRLASAGIPDAGIEARTLVRHALGVSQSELLLEPQRQVEAGALAKLDLITRQRLDHEPIQYITGEVEFYGRKFTVDDRVLIPRPETELLVEQALAFVNEQSIAAPRILDVGTGSGVLGLTLAAEIEESSVIATDISEDALAVAAENAVACGVAGRVDLLHGSLADGVERTFDVVVCNPPYVLTSFLDGNEVQAELAQEPRIALDGGADGMDFYRPLIASLDKLLNPLAAAFVEIDPPVALLSLKEAVRHLPNDQHSVLTDLAGLERCLTIERIQ